VSTEKTDKTYGKVIILIIILICIAIAIIYTVFLSLERDTVSYSRANPKVLVTEIQPVEERQPQFEVDLPTFVFEDSNKEVAEVEVDPWSLEALRLYVETNGTFYFKKDQSILLTQEITKLDEFINFLSHYTELEIEIHGHTADVWLKKYQKVLSKNRAEAIDILLQKELAKNLSSIKTIGFGSEQLIKQGIQDEVRQLNRRAQVFVRSAKKGELLP